MALIDPFAEKPTAPALVDPFAQPSSSVSVEPPSTLTAPLSLTPNDYRSQDAQEAAFSAMATETYGPRFKKYLKVYGTKRAGEYANQLDLLIDDYPLYADKIDSMINRAYDPKTIKKIIESQVRASEKKAVSEIRKQDEEDAKLYPPLPTSAETRAKVMIEKATKGAESPVQADAILYWLTEEEKLRNALKNETDPARRSDITEKLKAAIQQKTKAQTLTTAPGELFAEKAVDQGSIIGRSAINTAAPTAYGAGAANLTARALTTKVNPIVTGAAALTAGAATAMLANTAQEKVAREILGEEKYNAWVQQLAEDRQRAPGTVFIGEQLPGLAVGRINANTHKQALDAAIKVATGKAKQLTKQEISALGNNVFGGSVGATMELVRQVNEGDIKGLELLAAFVLNTAVNASAFDGAKPAGKISADEITRTVTPAEPGRYPTVTRTPVNVEPMDVKTGKLTGADILPPSRGELPPTAPTKEQEIAQRAVSPLTTKMQELSGNADARARVAPRIITDTVEHRGRTYQRGQNGEWRLVTAQGDTLSVRNEPLIKELNKLVRPLGATDPTLQDISGTSRRRSTAIQLAKESEIPDPEGFVDHAIRVSKAEKDAHAKVRDPVTGRTMDSFELMAQLKSEGKPEMGAEFSQRRGYTKAEYDDFVSFQRRLAEIEKRLPIPEDAAYVAGVAQGALEHGADTPSWSHDYAAPKPLSAPTAKPTPTGLAPITTEQAGTVRNPLDVPVAAEAPVPVAAIAKQQPIKLSLATKPTAEPTAKTEAPELTQPMASDAGSIATGPLESAASWLKSQFAFGKNRGGLTPELNDALRKSRGGMMGTDEVLRIQAQKLRKTKEWEKLKAAHGTTVESDLVAAMNAGSHAAMDAFGRKYGLDANSPITYIGKRLIDVDKIERQTLLNSKHLSQAEKDSIKANGIDYRKVSYLRYMIGDQWARYVSPTAKANAAREMFAGIQDDIKALRAKIKTGTATQTDVDEWAGLIEPVYGTTGRLTDVVEVTSKIKTALDSTIDYYLTRKGAGVSVTGEGIPVQHLLRRHLAGAFKELYGEIKDPIDAALQSIQSVRHLAVQSAMLDDIMKAGMTGPTRFVAKTSVRPDNNWVKLESPTGRFGQLEGAWVRKELYDALVPNRKAETSVGRLMQEANAATRPFVAAMRLAKLANIPGILRNKIQSYGQMLGTGDLLRPVHATRARKQINDLFKRMEKNDPAALAQYEQLVRDGIIKKGRNSLTTELSDSLSAPAQLVKTSGSAVTRGERVYDTTTQAARKLVDKFGRFYSSIDNDARVWSYFTRLQMGDTVEQATEHIRRHFQDPDSVAKIAQTLSSKTPLTDFVTYKLDSVRMRVNNLKYALQSAKSGDLVPLAGFLAQSAASVLAVDEVRKTLSKMTGDKIKHLTGSGDAKIEELSQEDQADVRAMLPRYYRDSNLMSWYQDGKPVVLVTDNMSGYPVEQMIIGTMQRFQESGWDGAIESLGDLSKSSFAQPNMFWNTAWRETTGYDYNARRKTGENLAEVMAGRRPASEKARAVGESVMDFMKEFAPGDAANKAQRLADYYYKQKHGALPTNLRGEIATQTPGQMALAAVLPIRTLTVDLERAAQVKGYEIYREMTRLKQEAGRIRNQKESVGAITPDDDEKLQSYYAQIKTQYMAADELRKTVDRLASRGSLDPTEVRAIFKGIFGEKFVDKGGITAYNDYVNPPVPLEPTIDKPKMPTIPGVP